MDHDFYYNFQPNFTVTDQEQQIINAQKKVEIKLTAVFVEHNIAFRAMDHMVNALKSCITDSKVLF